MQGVGGTRGPCLTSVRCPGAGVSSSGRPGTAGSDTAALAQLPPQPPPPSRAQTSPGPASGAAPNRRLGNVRGVSVPRSPPGRRARLSTPGTSRLSSAAREELRRRLLGLIEGHRVVIFSKSYCPHSARVGGQGLPGPLVRRLRGPPPLPGSSGPCPPAPRASGPSVPPSPADPVRKATPVPPSSAGPRGPAFSLRTGLRTRAWWTWAGDRSATTLGACAVTNSS